MMTHGKTWDATALCQLQWAYREARVFLTAVELDLFSLLADTPLTAADVIERRQTDLRATTMLLDAVTALGLLRKEGETYQVEPSAAPLLTAHSEQSIHPLSQHAADLWPLWSQLTDVVRTGKAPERPSREERNREEYRAFILAMHVLGRLVADAVVAAINAEDVQQLLDVGGATGTYTIAFLKAQHEMTATLFDLPQVIDLARESLRREGYLDRVTLHPGDFYTDDLPGGHDLALLSAIIHQNSRSQNQDLYRKVHAALVPGGRVIIRDYVMDRSRTQPPDGALFAINMLVATKGGATYTFDEIKEDLEHAGFSEVRVLQSPEPTRGLVQAIRR